MCAEPSSIHTCLSPVPTGVPGYPARPGGKRDGAMSTRHGGHLTFPLTVRAPPGPGSGSKPSCPHTVSGSPLAPWLPCTCKRFAPHFQQLCSCIGQVGAGACLSQSLSQSLPGVPCPLDDGGHACSLLSPARLAGPVPTERRSSRAEFSPTGASMFISGRCVWPMAGKKLPQQ